MKRRPRRWRWRVVTLAGLSCSVIIAVAMVFSLFWNVQWASPDRMVDVILGGGEIDVGWSRSVGSSPPPAPIPGPTMLWEVWRSGGVELTTWFSHTSWTEATSATNIVRTDRWGVPLWVPFVLGFIPMGWFLFANRLRNGRCPHCHYDLSGSPAGPCPECGHTPTTPAAPKKAEEAHGGTSSA